MKEEGHVHIRLKTKDGQTIELKKVVLEKGEVIDSSRLQLSALVTFFEEELKESKDKG